MSRPGSSLAGSENLNGLIAEGGAALAKQEMQQKGYLPADEYVGIMAFNKELREIHKRLRAELVGLQVEHERLRMEEAFLRDSVVQAGLKPPPEVPALNEAAAAETVAAAAELNA